MDAQTWTNLGVAAGTFALAGVTVWLGYQTKESVKAAREQADLAFQAVEEARKQTAINQQAVHAAEESVKEAERARSDERAPSVVAFLEPITWPPLLDISRRSMPYANELRLLDDLSIQRSRQVDESDEFVFDQDAEAFLWFRMRGLLINEGKSSARVRLDGEARFLNEESPFVLRPTHLAQSHSTGPPKIRAQVGTWVPESGLFAEYVLRPGQEAVFEWSAGHTLREWADANTRPDPPNPNGRLFFTVTTFDYFGSGVTEWIFIEAAGRPIEPVAGRNASWRLTSSKNMAHIAYPNMRHYRADKLPPPTPPWAE